MTADFPLAFFLQPVLADIGLSLLQLLLFFVSLWLIFLILIQRGKGGGLTAAFGGGGGDSAFGAKAGDAFTKITVISALVWITLCMVTIARYNPPDQAENPYAQVDEQPPAEEGLSAGPTSSSSMSGGEAKDETKLEPMIGGEAASGTSDSAPESGGEAAADGDDAEGDSNQ